MENRPHAEIVNDVVKLIIGRLVSRALSKDPRILEKARERLEIKALRDGESDYIITWRGLLDGPVDDVRSVLVSRDEESYWLRLTSPFSAADAGYPIKEEGFRRRLWKDARNLVMMGHSRDRNFAHDRLTDMSL